MNYERKVLASSIFYSSDFNEGRSMKRWWDRQFKKASKMSNKELVDWAKEMLEEDYANRDFKESVYYLRDEIIEQFKRIVRKGKKYGRL